MKNEWESEREIPKQKIYARDYWSHVSHTTHAYSNMLLSHAMPNTHKDRDPTRCLLFLFTVILLMMIVRLDGITHYLVFKLNLTIRLFGCSSIPFIVSPATSFLCALKFNVTNTHCTIVANAKWLGLSHRHTFQFSFRSLNHFLFCFSFQVQMHPCVSLDRYSTSTSTPTIIAYFTHSQWAKEYHLSVSIKTMSIIYHFYRNR